ncbi:MAG: hypothetical protein KDC80_23295 [Saprospiraceae bacterium]|nr:hypothetical protein [Saprospiraceae bacterium]
MTPSAVPNFDQFLEVIDSDFQVEFIRHKSIEVRLVEVRKLSKDEESLVQFSLIFQSGQSDQYFTQATVNLDHQVLGSFHLFLVPIGLGKAGFMQYEAIISRTAD